MRSIRVALCDRIRLIGCFLRPGQIDAMFVEILQHDLTDGGGVDSGGEVCPVAPWREFAVLFFASARVELAVAVKAELHLTGFAADRHDQRLTAADRGIVDLSGLGGIVDG